VRAVYCVSAHMHKVHNVQVVQMCRSSDAVFHRERNAESACKWLGSVPRASGRKQVIR
jgi:hypothetical protein